MKLEQKNILETPKGGTVEEIKKLSAIQEKDLKRIRAENERLKSELSQYKKGRNPKEKSETDAAGALAEELELLSKVYDDLQEQNSRLLEQLSGKDDANTQLMSERIKSKQQQQLLKQESDILKKKVMKIEEKCNVQIELLQKENTKIKLLQDQALKYQEDIRNLQTLADSNKRIARENGAIVQATKAQLDQLQIAYNTLNKKCEEQNIKIEDITEHIRNLEEDKASYKRKYDKLTERFKPGNDSVLEEELKVCKAQLKCPVCNDRPKDAVITKCFHTFCNPCLKKNLNIRHRKCPSCSQPFGEKDVHPIFLGFK